MSAQIFIDKLEASNLLDVEVIVKLRKKIAKPGKTPPAQSVAKYCLEKGFLTQVQADKLLQSVAQDVKQHKAQSSAPLELAEEASVISAADLVEEVIEPGAVEQPQEIVDLSANAPMAEAVQPLAEIADPFALPGGTPANPTGGMDPYNGATPQSEANGPPDEEEKKEFKGKKIQEQSFDSRWIILGSALLVILVLSGLFFAMVIAKGSSDEVFNEAEELFATQSYPAAVEQYKAFIKNFKGDPNVPKAHVKFRVAEMKIAASGKDVKNTVEVFREKIEKITQVMADQIEEPPFEDEIRKMIALDTVTCAQKAAESAANLATVEEKEAALEKAKDMMVLVMDGKFVPRSERELPSFASMIEATQATLNNVEQSIIREKDTVQAVGEITSQTDSGDTYKAFQTYDQLVTRHPSAEADQRVIKVLLEISKKEKGLVTSLNPEIEKLENVGAENPPALISRVSIPTRTGGGFDDLNGEVGAFLVDGSVYGVDVGAGKIIWRHFVGYETSLDPVWLREPTRVLLSDQKNHRIRLVEPATGKTVWHKSIGEPFLKPTVSRNKIFITMKSGKLARVDSETGDISAVVKLPQKVTVPVITNASGNVLYQVGEHLNLYVLNVTFNSIECIQAFYTGHSDGSIQVPPIWLQDVLVLPVNVDSNTCELRLMTNEKESLTLRTAGEAAELRGIVSKSPRLYGNYLVTMTVNGTVNVFELDSDDEEFQMAAVAKKELNLPTTQEIFFAAGNGKIWIGTKGIVQYAVVVAKQKIQDQAVANNADFFTGEMSVYEGLLVHQRKRAGSRMVSISGVNPDTLNEIWRLDLGGGLAGAPIVNNETVVAINSQGDFYRMDDQLLANRVSHEPEYRASKTQQNLVFTRSVGFPDGSGFIIGPMDRKDSISYIPGNNSLPVSLSEMNVNDLRITCDPIKFKNGVLVGLNNGEIRHLIPRGTSEDAVFVPKADVSDEFFWQRPCIISQDTFAVANHDGRLFLVKYVTNNGNPYMAQVIESKASRKIIGPLINNGSLILTLGDGPNGNDVIAINPANLKIEGSYTLGGIATWGPEAVGNVALATREDGTLLGFGKDINTPDWEVKLPHGRATGLPISWKGNLVITLKDGKIAVVNAEDKSVKIIDTREPIAGHCSLAGDRLYFSGVDGSIGVVDLSKMESQD